MNAAAAVEPCTLSHASAIVQRGASRDAPDTVVYGLLPDVSKDFTIVALIKIGCSRISGPVVEQHSLLAIMGIRAPRANR
jgi:hypothetical protein